MGFKNAVKKSIKSHTLFDEIGGFVIHKTGYANKYLSGINAMYKTYTKLNKKYARFINNGSIKKYDCEDMNNTVWICWLQGIENAPELVKNCFESVKYHIKDKNIIVLDENNLFDYTDLPDYIIDKWKKGIISNTHFSDLLRINVLNRHGGLWLDATTYLTGEIPDYVYSTDFFVYRNGWFDEEMINMGSWFIYSKPNNLLLLETEKLLHIYWQKSMYLNQYFLMHIFFRMVTDKYNELWQQVPNYNHINQHMLAQELGKKFNPIRFSQIKELTPVHKLTNKLDNIEFEDDSYYSRLSNIYK